MIVKHKSHITKLLQSFYALMVTIENRNNWQRKEGVEWEREGGIKSSTIDCEQWAEI